MCFINNDCKWTRTFMEEYDTTYPKDVQCDECRGTIPTGQTVHHVFMRKEDLGESFDYDRCEGCDKFLRAVESAELEAGCRLYAARPALGTMAEELSDVGIHNRRRYFKAALRMFPELKASGYLTALGKRFA